jgi:hypothetical protein
LNDTLSGHFTMEPVPIYQEETEKVVKQEQMKMQVDWVQETGKV